MLQDNKDSADKAKQQQQQKTKLKTVERVARLQQYRQGVWELNFDFRAFERWRSIGSLHGLSSDTEIASFLLQQ